MTLHENMLPGKKSPQPSSNTIPNGADRNVLLRRTAWLVPVLFALFCSSSALQNLRAGDDDLLIFHNAKAKSMDFLWENLTGDYFYTDLPTSIGYYRPAPKVGYQLQFAIFGYDETGYHAVSIAWFVIAVFFAYALLLELGTPLALAALAATFFATHPAQAMPVGVITAQSDVMVVAGILASFYGYLRWAATDQRVWMVATLFAYAFALASKETAVVVWVFAFLFEFVQANSNLRQLNYKRLGWFLLPVTGYAIVRLGVDVMPLTSSYEEQMTSDSLIAAGVILFQSIVKALFSIWTPTMSSQRPPSDLAHMLLWTLPLFLGIVATGWAFLRRSRFQWALALLLIPLLPALSPAVRIHLADTIVSSERWILLPALGAGLLWATIAWVVIRPLWPRPVTLVMFMLAFVPLTLQGWVTRAEVGSFRTEADKHIFLAEHIKKGGGPLSPVQRQVVALAELMQAKRDRPTSPETWNRAALIYGRILDRDPHNFTHRYLLGEALFHQGKYVDALYHLLISYFGVDPKTKKKLPLSDSLGRHRPARSFLIAQIYEKLGDKKEALYFFQQTLRFDPTHDEAKQRLVALVSAEAGTRSRDKRRP